MQEQEDSRKQEEARVAAIKAAYADCEQNFLVVGDNACGGSVQGKLEIEGLIFEGEEMIEGYSYPDVKPNEKFLSFMYNHGWEILIFNVNSSDHKNCTFHYTMIFKKR